MGSRVHFLRRELALIGVAMAVAAGVLPFSPSAAAAATPTDASRPRQVAATAASHCYVQDTFNRTVDAGWGSTDTGQAWTDSLYDSAGNVVSVQPVNGSVSGGAGSVVSSEHGLEFSAGVSFPDPGVPFDIVVRGQFPQITGTDWAGVYVGANGNMMPNLGFYGLYEPVIQAPQPVQTGVVSEQPWYSRVHLAPDGSGYVKWWQADQVEPQAWLDSWGPSSGPPANPGDARIAGLGVHFGLPSQYGPLLVSYFSIGDSQCFSPPTPMGMTVGSGPT